MPAKPLLAKVTTPPRGRAKPSRSRIGRDDETKNAVSLGIAAAIVRAITASFQPSRDATSFLVLSATLFQVAIQDVHLPRSPVGTLRKSSKSSSSRPG